MTRKGLQEGILSMSRRKQGFSLVFCSMEVLSKEMTANAALSPLCPVSQRRKWKNVNIARLRVTNAPVMKQIPILLLSRISVRHSEGLPQLESLPNPYFITALTRKKLSREAAQERVVGRIAAKHDNPENETLAKRKGLLGFSSGFRSCVGTSYAGH